MRAITFLHEKKHDHSLIAGRFLFLLILILSLLASGCYKAPDVRLPAEYFETSWECTDPYAAFDADAEGFCTGTLVYEELSLQVKVNFRYGISHRSGRISFVVNDEGPEYYIFGGEFEIAGDTMTITGTWSEFVEKIYHQPYDPGECTLIFERRQ